MTLKVSKPSDIYQRINRELEHIIQSLQEQSSDDLLDDAHTDALKQLSQCQTELRNNLASLENNAEWNTFTIAFYGETGAGKSTIVETLRILLCEPKKMASQQAFRELQEKYDLSKENLQKLSDAVEHADRKLKQIDHLINSTKQKDAQQYQDAKKHVENLRNRFKEQKYANSLWQKILCWCRGLLEKLELAAAERHLLNISASGEIALRPFLNQQINAEQYKKDLVQQLHEHKVKLKKLTNLADGTIIGDGSSDFTRQTQRYDFDLGAQKFSLLDVPGIEGKEGLVLEEIENALQTAHAVFYVTNQAAPPQTGDEERKGTLEKIKDHLSAQTEVWTLFNKKIANPIALASQQFIKDDEQSSLDGLDEKMRETLGRHYCGTFTLSALPAFLASTDHFIENSQSARRRIKFLDRFDRNELIEKSQIRAFIQTLGEHLLSNSNDRIKAANFNQAKNKVDEISTKIQHIEETFSDISGQLKSDGESSCKQLQQSFSILKQYLETGSIKATDELVSCVRGPVYQLIKLDVSNDEFKIGLHRHIQQEQEQFNKKISNLIREEVEVFRQDAESILKRFEEHSQKLEKNYNKLINTTTNEDFDLQINLDNGINVWGLLGGVVGLAVAPFTGGASLWVTGTALLTSLLSVGKAVWGAFSSSYKQSQQRKVTDENLRRLSKKLQDIVFHKLDEVMEDMQQVIKQIEQALNTPGQQAEARAHILKKSIKKLNLLSRQISNAGGLT